MYPLRETADLCSSTQINPPDADTTVTIISADGIGCYSANGTTIATNLVGTSYPPSENDYSIGILIQFGKFSYVTSGDLTGQYTISYDSSYNGRTPSQIVTKDK